MFRASSGRYRLTPNGEFYLIGYGVIRFILEFFRYDAFRGIYGVFSVSQWVSLALIVLGLFFWFWRRAAKKETVAG